MFAGGWLVIVVAPETVSVAGSGNNNTFLTKKFLVLDKVQYREMSLSNSAHVQYITF